MSHQDSKFLAWQAAERRASSAERELYTKLIDGSGAVPSRAEVEEARVLRTRATQLIKEMLEDMQARAEQLKFSDTAAEAKLILNTFTAGARQDSNG